MKATGVNESVLKQIPAVHIREAAERVADALPTEHDRRRAREELAALGRALAERADGSRMTPTRWTTSPLARPLLSALCLEVVRGWARSEPAPDVDLIVRTFRAFESLVADFGGQRKDKLPLAFDHDFASQLSGLSGLELVVEVAHDLRSPITSILFLAETLQRGQSGPVNELQHRQLGLIYSAALGLSTLASNVMELARGGNRLTDDHAAPFSVKDVMESVVDIVRPMAEEKGLSIRLLSPTLDHRLGSAQALSRVLLNLTTNALKFTEEGFVELVGKDLDLDRVEFSVRDSGRGIGQDALATLFQPFRQTPSREGRAFSGTGLGLALCRKIVEVMGSSLEFETRENWGTRFYFELKLPPAERP